MNDKLTDALYYHGLLPREDIKAMLRVNGDFLLRTSEPMSGQPRTLVVSVMVDQNKEDQGILHYLIRRSENGKFSIERESFDSVIAMINHHLSNAESISKTNDQVILRSPVLRQTWELTHENIEVTKKLGEGAFGEVWLGKLTRKPTMEKVDVAVKLAKLETLTKEQVKEIMHEARLMRMFDHPNVIRIYGVAAMQEPLMLVMELASDGALDSYLRKHDVSVDVKNQMCGGASFGLEYLHNACKVIHRDIAARNCLYGEGQVKISDFGLTREGPIYQMNPSKKVPIRWLSPETLRTAMYSQKSDVFSYGILCWEIYSNGIEPYPGMMVAEVNVKVKEGYRMPFPSCTPPIVSSTITAKCWCDGMNERATMSEVCKFWERNVGIRRPAPLMASLYQTTTEYYNSMVNDIKTWWQKQADPKKGEASFRS